MKFFNWLGLFKNVEYTIQSNEVILNNIKNIGNNTTINTTDRNSSFFENATIEKNSTNFNINNNDNNNSSSENILENFFVTKIYNCNGVETGSRTCVPTLFANKYNFE
jgi:hypothetical protein